MADCRVRTAAKSESGRGVRSSLRVAGGGGGGGGAGSARV